MNLHDLVARYFDRPAGVFVPAAVGSAIFALTFWLSLWCVEYVGMGDNLFRSWLFVGLTVSFAATTVFVLASAVCVILVFFAGWILTFGWVFASLLVFELVQIGPKVYDRIDGHINPSPGDVLSIIVLLAPVALLAVAFWSARNHEKELARLRNIPLTSKHEWSQDDG